MNNDGYPEIFVSDMLPQAMKWLQSKIAFHPWEEYDAIVRDGCHYQATRNTLQLNRGPRHRESDHLVYFSEVGRLFGIEATDWSWGGLFADFDLDGYRDLFVPNGMYKDLFDQDFIARVSNADTLRAIFLREKEPILELLSHIPSFSIANFMFAGDETMRFRDVGQDWGLAEQSYSNGSAYGDLDNNGDLDLVVNNVNMSAFVYRNHVTERHPDRSWLQVDVGGRIPNTQATGAQLTFWHGGTQWYVEQQPVRGLRSTVDHTLSIGFGARVRSGLVDSLVVRWPDGNTITIRDIPVNQRLRLVHGAPDISGESP